MWLNPRVGVCTCTATLTTVLDFVDSWTDRLTALVAQRDGAFKSAVVALEALTEHVRSLPQLAVPAASSSSRPNAAVLNGAFVGRGKV